MNDPARWQRTEKIFHRALGLEGAREERTARVREWCAGDEELAAEVLSLLVAADALDESCLRPSGPENANPWIGRVLGGYQIDALIGRGGMGAVYAATRVGAEGGEEEQVAIKVVGARLYSPLFQERFLEERRALASLAHPNIVRLLDGGVTEAGEPYLVMEFIHGERLDEHCERTGASRDAMLKLILQLCDAASCAHRNRILHGDLKPSNVLVTADGQVKLLDFGTAMLLAAEAGVEEGTASLVAAFTPAYASPEKVRGEACAVTADVYSLGAMLYRLLAGHAPAAATTALTVKLLREMEETPGDDPATPPDSSMETPDDLAAIAAKAMSARPEDRYPSVAELIADIERYRSCRPVRARQATSLYRARKFIRRRRASLAVGAMLLIAFLAGGAAAMRETRIARAEEMRARNQMLNVRQLANFLVADFYDRLAEVPGSTGTLHKAAAESLSFLDGMSRDAAGDAGFEMDLANAYTRLGNVLGSRYEANLGDAPEGIKTVEKGVAVAQDALRLRPGDPEVLRCVVFAERSLSELEFSGDRTRDALSHAMAAAALSEKLMSMPGATAADLRAEASVYSLIGDQYGLQGAANLGDQQAAMANYRKSLELHRAALARDGGDTAAMRAIATDWEKIANLTREAQPEMARQEYQSAVDMVNRIPHPAPSVQRYRTFLQERIGLCDFYEHKYRESLREFLPAQRTQEASLAQDPLNMRFLQNLSLIYLDEGGSHSALHEWEAARADYQRLAAVLVRALRRNPQNHAWQEHYAETLILLADVERHIAGRAGEAEEHERKGLELSLRMTEEAGASADDMDSAALHLLDAEPQKLRDPQRALALSSRAVALTHSAAPDYLLTLARAYAACQRVAEARQTAHLVLTMQPAPETRNGANELLKSLKGGGQ